MKFTLGEKLLLSVPTLWLIVTASIAATMDVDLFDKTPKSDSAALYQSDLAKHANNTPFILQPQNTDNSSSESRNRQPAVYTTRTGIWDSEPLCYHYGQTRTRSIPAYFALPRLLIDWVEEPQAMRVVLAGVRDDIASCRQSIPNPKQDTATTTANTLSTANLSAANPSSSVSESWLLRTQLQTVPNTISLADLDEPGSTDLNALAVFEEVPGSENSIFEEFPTTIHAVFAGQHDMLWLPYSHTNYLSTPILSIESLFDEELLQKQLNNSNAMFFGIIPDKVFPSDFEIKLPDITLLPRKFVLAEAGADDRLRENRPIFQLSLAGTPPQLSLRYEETLETPKSVPEPVGAAALLLVLGSLWAFKRKS